MTGNSQPYYPQTIHFLNIYNYLAILKQLDKLTTCLSNPEIFHDLISDSLHVA